MVRPAGVRDEPVAPTFKTTTEQLTTRAATTRYEVQPPIYKNVFERVVDVPEHTIQRVIPAKYKEVQERVLVNAATTRTETVPTRYRSEVERVLVRPEVLQYVPVVLPTKQVAEQRLRSAATTKVVPVPAAMETAVVPVEVRPASVRREAVPAAYDVVTEQVKVSEPYREWRRGRAWVNQAVDVVPVRGFVVDPSGQFKGYRVEGRTLVAAATGGVSRGVVDKGLTQADNTDLEDDVWCLVDVPAEGEGQLVGGNSAPSPCAGPSSARRIPPTGRARRRPAPGPAPPAPNTRPARRTHGGAPR